MRKFLLVLIVIVVIAGAIAAFLFVTTPTRSDGVRFPLSGRDLALLAKVPPNADALAIIPDAAAVQGDMKTNPVLRDAVDVWTARQQLPAPWMIGGADLVVWRIAKQTTFAVDLDPIRAAILRVYLQMSGGRSPFLINAPGTNPVDAEIQALAATLPPGDFFVAQRRSGRGAFPPIGRPAVTSVQVSEGEVLLTSRAAREETLESGGKPPHSYGFPASAMFSASFASPPRAIEDLNRIFGARVSSLFSDGGAISIYEVNVGTFLPSPKGVIVLPATDARREAVRELGSVGGLLRSRDTGETILVAFDPLSIDRYVKDQKVPAPAGEWAIRADPPQLVPVLERAGDSLGLRVAAPRLFRAVRDLRQWIGNLSEAQVAEAEARGKGGVDELRVRIATRMSE